jgi:virginiamycin B lyase
MLGRSRWRRSGDRRQRSHFFALLAAATGLSVLGTGPAFANGAHRVKATARPSSSGRMTFYRSGLGQSADLVDIAAGPYDTLWFTTASSSEHVIGEINTKGKVHLFNDGLLVGALSITAGPDGAMWFTTGADSSNTSIWGASIGRISATGVVTTYPLTGVGAGDIVAGPDGALWFTYGGPSQNPSSGIGRITTSGQMTFYPDPSGNIPTSITAGPDGALWFAAVTSDFETTHQIVIGRIATDGAFTDYLAPFSGYPSDITTGPDGALWFTDINSIGRVTTSGDFSNYPYATGEASGPTGITSADGAIWFTNDGWAPAIGRMSTGGTVTLFRKSRLGKKTKTVGPYQITGGTGAVWFTDHDNGTIGRFSFP